MPAKKRPSPRADAIHIVNARQHNLKGLDLDIPLGKLTVVTGPSGSGKSSLAFHTLYAEGQRRYVETFSPYVRQFFDRMDKPAVDRIDGIPPAIAIEQKNSVRTTRSTVGTLTEINDYLKLLFARMARGYDPDTGEEIFPDTAESAREWLLEHAAAQAVLVTFPITTPADLPREALFQWLSQQGFLRVVIDGQIHRTDELASYQPSTHNHQLSVIQDRVTVNAKDAARLFEALEAAFRLGKGRCAILDAKSSRELRAFSIAWVNPATGFALRPPSPALFSFNNPLGACPVCRGFGRVIGLDLEKAVPDHSLTLKRGAIKPFQGERGEECQRDLIKCCKERGVDVNTPWEDLTDDEREWIYYGDRRKDRDISLEELEELWRDGKWYGVKGYFDWLESKTYKMHIRVFLSRYRSYTTCNTCRGKRLQPEALCFKVNGKTLPEVWSMPVSDLASWFSQFQLSAFSGSSADASLQLILNEISTRLTYLGEVGLGYLTLDRQTRTLSGGEVERVNLTTCLGASLTNTLFVLDEPTVGLHARDIGRLVGVMQNLRDKGNTLVVVEHEEAVMRAADHFIDLGPGSGQHGGELIYAGTAEEVISDQWTVISGKRKKLLGTAPWLTGEKKIVVPAKRRKPTKLRLEIRGATRHNLRKLDVDVPLGLFVCLTGVSGSGKSTFAHDVLFANVAKLLKKDIGEADAAPVKQLKGVNHLGDVQLVDQSPLARTPRSTAALLLGAFDPIRQLFSLTDDAKSRGVQPGFFSFNSGDGRCDRCAGAGSEKVEMQFLSDIEVPCPDCAGRRYRPTTLEILYRGKSIADVLELTAEEAIAFYQAGGGKRELQVVNLLHPLVEVGLGYLKLGQPLNTLSGGESQRLKLCQLLAETSSNPKSTITNRESSIRNPQSKLLILDEPTTGLHFSDIERLLGVFQRLVDAGHSLLVIEHNMDVIKSADWILDLGPDAGARGGQLVAQGTPEEIAKLDTETSRYLKPALTGTSSRQVRPSPSSLISNLSLSSSITLRGAREHNLKNVSVDIPHDQFVVISGLSGSGKSTLAFDILFAEGQRRFLDSMSVYARQFAEQMEKPEFDALAGLPPTVAIEQRVSQGGMKSTVATVTELWNFIRLLYAKLGTRYCPDCQVPVEKQSHTAIEQELRRQLKKGALKILAPVIRGRKGFHNEVAEWALKHGYTELLADKRFVAADGFQRLERFKEHDVDVVVGSFPLSAASKGKQAGPELETALTKALEIGKGVIRLFTADKKFVLLSTEASCPSCRRSFDELDPRLFSFNSPHGWCTQCRGHGVVPKRARYLDTSRFDSVLAAEMDADRSIERMEEEELVECPSCHGARLNAEGRAVRLNDAPLSQLARLAVDLAAKHFEALKFSGEREQLIARDILPEIRQRLAFLQHVGLGYLQLDRSAKTLSGGESQRIRLAAQLGSNLRGVLYVLDEPTIGLHPRDNAALLDTLVALRDRGNSLIVVEHDEDTIARADHLIDLGPGAGRLGGQVVYQGKPPQVGGVQAQGSSKGKKNSSLITDPCSPITSSPTFRALTAPIIHPSRGERRAIGKTHSMLKLTGCCANNLKDIDAAIPLGRLTVLTGISGSGKSSLMHGCIAAAAAKTAQLVKSKTWTKASGFDAIQSVYEVDQSPIGKTSRSCPATYVKVFDEIRKLFAQLPESRMRGYEASRFSFNTGDGRCPVCEGNGRVKLEMDFLPPTWVPCEACLEMRYNPATLEVRFREKNIGEVLHLTIDEAAAFFEAQPRIAAPLKLLADTGLGYLQLGQPSPTLSGGEAQRIKLVSELIRGRSIKAQLKNPKAEKRNLYLIEEPTVGLHLEDVNRLIDVLHRLADEGHTVVVIEHHMAVAAEADWILDMGPEAGAAGGTIVAQGTPEQVAKSKPSRTAPFLKAMLGGS